MKLAPALALLIPLSLLLPRPARCEPSYASVKGWRMIPWGTELDEAKRLLRTAGIGFKDAGSAIGYFPDLGGCMEVGHLELTTHRWRVALQFRWGRLVSVSLTRTVESAQKAEVVIAQIRARYGKPQFEQPPSAVYGALRFAYSNPGSQLSVNTFPQDGKVTIGVLHEAVKP